MSFVAWDIFTEIKSELTTEWDASVISFPNIEMAPEDDGGAGGQPVTNVIRMSKIQKNSMPSPLDREYSRLTTTWTLTFYTADTIDATKIQSEIIRILHDKLIEYLPQAKQGFWNVENINTNVIYQTNAYRTDMSCNEVLLGYELLRKLP